MTRTAEDQRPTPDVVRRAIRLGRLAGLPLASLVDAGEGAVRRVRGEDPDVVSAALRRRSAERTRRVLGQAKGGALKAGQLLSTVDALFPADPEQSWSTALAALPADNPPLPFAEVEPVLAADLGPAWRDQITWIDTATPSAASIGQVHRASLAGGRDVAVKVQYPGVADDLRVDLRAVSAVSWLSALIAPGMSLPPLVAEVRERLAEELDYTREGLIQQAFADACADDPTVAVPEVVTATRRVLISDWLSGTPFTHLRGAPQAERDAMGLAYMRFLLSGPARTGWLHTDPHPGNFLALPDGRLGVVDFGSALALPDGMPPTFGRLISVLGRDDPGYIREGLEEEGFVRPAAEVDAVKLRDYLSPFIEPSRHEVFTFTPEWLRSQFGRLGDPRNPDFAVALQLTMPAEHLFTHRVWLGIVGVLCQLRATIPVRDEVRRWLPGLE
ncbi:ABC1 kinase family protein [Euzebya sp.]|uniref:ABC1 kinase family protein n=1 Tax=Euzebya sp. TaxID=1971409 RepID=UPI0035133B26